MSLIFSTFDLFAFLISESILITFSRLSMTHTLISWLSRLRKWNYNLNNSMTFQAFHDPYNPTLRTELAWIPLTRWRKQNATASIPVIHTWWVLLLMIPWELKPMSWIHLSHQPLWTQNIINIIKYLLIILKMISTLYSAPLRVWLTTFVCFTKYNILQLPTQSNS